MRRAPQTIKLEDKLNKLLDKTKVADDLLEQGEGTELKATADPEETGKPVKDYIVAKKRAATVGSRSTATAAASSSGAAASGSGEASARVVERHVWPSRISEAK